MKLLHRARWASVVMVLAFLLPASASASTYSNSTPVSIPGNPSAAAGPASPYPSVISVGGLPGTVVKARAMLAGISHEDSGVDIDILLMGPGGQKTILISDACASLMSPLNLTFDDAAASSLPQVSGCVSGTFKPTDYPGIVEMFPSPAPAGPYQAALAGFNGTFPNGAWQLFVVDDAGPDTDASSIAGGWSLELLTKVACSGKPATAAANVGTADDDVIVGTPDPDVMLGLGGNDTIRGLAGKDIVCGGPGRDKLLGGPGKDLLRGEAGKDKLKGQGGKDTCAGGAKPDTAKSCEKQKSI